MEAVVLAGGFGTRLSHIVSDMPKPMAPINDEPFLKYVFEYLLKNGVTHTVLAVGYMAEYISNYFGDSYKDLQLTYSKEESPLGTGGAIKAALTKCKTDDIFIINGDTFFDVNLKEMLESHVSFDSKLTVATKEMFNYDRYGTVVIDNNKIVEFKEKHTTDHGKINGGIYLINRDLLDNISEEQFSFETKILENFDRGFDVMAFDSNGYFIDIGVPDDYYQAQKDLTLV